MSDTIAGLELQDQVQVNWRQGVARIRITGAPGNPLTPGLILELERALSHALEEPGCRALVLEGAGPHFCSGLALDGLQDQPARTGLACHAFASCLVRLQDAPVPSLALVQGRVQGGGVGLAAACDLVLADRQAEFLLPEALVGMLPALIATVLERRLGLARFRYLALSTRPLKAEEALAFGLVDQIASEGLQPSCARQLGRLLRSAPGALAAIKTLNAREDGRRLQTELVSALGRLEEWLATPEALQGLRAAQQGHAPPWWQRCTEGWS